MTPRTKMKLVEWTFALILGAAVAGIALFVAKAVADNPPPSTPGPSAPRPDDVGACCMGPVDGVNLDTTRAECDGLGIFVKGVFSPTDEVSPCNLLPGGD